MGAELPSNLNTSEISRLDISWKRPEVKFNAYKVQNSTH